MAHNFIGPNEICTQCGLNPPNIQFSKLVPKVFFKNTDLHKKSRRLLRFDNQLTNLHRPARSGPWLEPDDAISRFLYLNSSGTAFEPER